MDEMSEHSEPTPPSDAPSTTDSFEAQLGRLAEIVARLESGSLGLSESIEAYERGVGILRRLHEELASAEARVSVLVKIDEQGRPVLEPLSDGGGEALPADSAQSTPTRRSRTGRAAATRTRGLPGMDASGEDG